MDLQKRKRILLVEDDPSVLRALERQLTRAGYTVILAENGAEAIRAWHAEDADLVITDLHMPERNGLELILELVSVGARTPIIAISDGGRTRQIELLGDARLLGALRTVPKPFSLEKC